MTDSRQHAPTETEAFTRWALDRDIEESEEAWAHFENWICREEWITKYGEDPTGYGEPFTGNEVDPAPFGGEAA